MKKIILYGTIISVALVLSALFGLYGLYQNKLAEAQESFSAFDFEDADKNYGEAEKYISYGNSIPWLLSSERASLKSSRLEANYWLGRYEDLTSEFQLQPAFDRILSPQESFIKGNAFYRILEIETNKTKVIGLLDVAILKYTEAINGDSSNSDAVFNYEYLLQVRNDVSSGKKKLPLKQQGREQSPGKNNGNQSGQESSIHGQEGAQSAAKGTDKMQIHVPMSEDESKGKNGKSQDGVGKGGVQRKRG